MKYFEQQRVDDIGILGVRIQKLVVVLTVANFLAFLYPNFLVWGVAFFNQLLLLVAFCGALKRRDSLLRLYVIVNVVIFILAIASVAVTVFMFHPQEADELTPPSNNTFVAPSNPKHSTESKMPKFLKLHSPKAQTAMNLHPANPSVSEHENLTVVDYTIGILFIAVKVIIFAIKITTIILCSRMANMLRARRNMSLAHPTKAPVSNPSRGVYQPVVYVPINGSQMQMPQGQAAFQPYYQPYMFNPYLQQQVQPPSQPSTFAYPTQV